MPLEEGSDSGADPSFLMELMELNEAVAEAQTPEEANRIGRDTKGNDATRSSTPFIDAGFRATARPPRCAR